MSLKVFLKNGLGYITGAVVLIDAYSILIDNKFLVFNHAIKGINLNRRSHENASKEQWGQIQLFKSIINKNKIKIFFEDGTNIDCKLVGYVQDKIFTDHPELSLIQKGSIVYIEIV